ncbi:LytTR family transcriptional regulator DNA-binding domain-containing protein [Phenylobacterium ferrooxidans]|uniref:LytTR family transcriptional regulator DNA-binding domain-containing protein n=1 Tax=Phenylobacterium ferrooxidans TaxID=2982689 RepID=A0ABW6CL35_9CAUL
MAFRIQGLRPSKLPRRPAVPSEWRLPITISRCGVHTIFGSALILMRLSDAVSRTSGEGLEVHRSWWVAKGAIRHVSRDGRNLRLNLLNGLEVRVARRAVIRLKELDPGPG